LRQGDPLAPLLFNIVGEGITGMMREAIQKNLYRRYLIGVYSTNLAYRLMMNPNRSGSHGRTFKIIWKLKIPPRAAAFS